MATLVAPASDIIAKNQDPYFVSLTRGKRQKLRKKAQRCPTSEANKAKLKVIRARPMI